MQRQQREEQQEEQQQQQQQQEQQQKQQREQTLAEEPRPPPKQCRDTGKENVVDTESDDLARSLRWSVDQLHADKAAKRLLQAEEVLLVAHAAATRHARE